MLFFTDRKFETICIAGSKDLPLLDDEFNENVETGTGILKAVVPKSHKDAEKIEVGNFVLSNDYKKETVALEVMEIFETRSTKEIIAEDAGLDLLNDEAGPIDMKGTLEDFAKATLGDDSSWDIGLNEIDPKKTMTLSYEGIATQTKRINQIAGRFDAEVSYSFNLKGNTILQKLVNFHKKRGKEIGQRIEIGKGLEDVRRHISITNLCTAIRPVGEPYQKTVKVVVPYNLLRASNRETSTKNYKVGEWQFAEEIKAGEEVTLTFKGVISPLQKFRVYNSGSNHSLAILEKVGDGIYSATFNWAIGSEGNTSLWAYQYPDRGTNNDTCLIEWAVLTKVKEVATKWLPSKADESGAEIPSATTASETITIGTLDGDARIEKMVQWFKSREGKVGYNDGGGRFGPDAYDCSSSILISAKHAGLIPTSAPTSNTASMMSWGNAGKYFYQIPSNQVKRGDIFVSRTANTGHTGLFLDNGRTIIHTTVGAGKRGIMTTPAKGWLGTGTIKYFRFNVLRDTPTQAVGTTPKAVSSGTFWTNSDLTRHDLGKSLQGLTAQQLNNWIQAKSPTSPFRGYGNLFLEAQKESGLDARYLLAHAAHESAWGKSNIAIKNKNYYGIGAIDSDPFNGSARYANADLASGIINGAKWIAKFYYNSTKYNQKTLYTMRFNGGVHEYATDPKWHTKIANIMKGSEPFTKASSIVTGVSAMGIIKSVPDIKYEDTTIEVELNLKGYKYDDGRYFVNEKGEICDREGLERWGRFKGYSNARSGYILRVYESEATTQKALLDEGLLQLQKNNTPFIDYEVSLAYLPEGVELGDTVRIIDHEYQPALYLDARLVDITKSSTDRRLNKAVFSNFVERESGINEKLLALQNMAKSLKWTWDSQPYTMDLVSSLGNLFKDGVISTDLIANITRMGIDQTSAIDYFIWERVSEYQDKLNVTDESWNATKQLVTGNVLHVTADDVDMQASFTCSAVVDGVVVASSAYTIKDLTIGRYKQDNEPDRSLLSWGDEWQSVTSDPPFHKIWKGDRWEDVITRNDLNNAGRNLLKHSNVNSKGDDYLIGTWDISEPIKVDEEITITLDAIFSDNVVLKIADAVKNEEITTLKELDENLYSSTFNWVDESTRKIALYAYPNFHDSAEYANLSIDQYQDLVTKGLTVLDKTYNIINVDIDIDIVFNWITLQKGNIPANDWVFSVDDLNESIDKKADGEAFLENVTKVEALEVHLQQYPPAESITKTAVDVEKTNAYLEALKTAIESDALTLQDRLAIIEANVGAGKLSIEAITTYFEFGEEGVLIGKQDEQVKLNLSNNALEIIDGDKVVARFANNQTETPNLRVSGVFEFGYHMASKMELNGKKYTVIRPV